MLIPSLFLTLSLQITIIYGCTISINDDLGDPQPLVLNPSGGYGHSAFHLPDTGDKIKLSNGETVQVACPGGVVVIGGVSTTSNVGTATCNNNKFTISSKSVNFIDITCSTVPYHTARATGNKCLTTHKEIEIGFDINNRFLKHIDVCFDESKDNVLYSKFNLTKTIDGYQSGYPRPSWIQGNFFSVSGVDNLYTKNNQRAVINNLLGLDENSYKYIAESSDFYLARGHLTAKADFLFGAQQRATFYFVNAAPQWQTFNGQNWMYLESDTRDFAASKNKDLIVYTGTYGVATLPHEKTGVDTELYLYVNGNNKRIPVPRLFWKVLYEPTTKAGVVFLGVNNPYVLNSSKDVICTDICSQYSWLTWDRKTISKGYGYCCSVADFRKVVTTLPAFEVTQLLNK
ncbi:uncharacterized protein [Onthophagus taurus]|uniref:uncharacterized protein n=1 Tax=Onthophagus taurus TaxID=166361 RepID=UPI0039BE8B1C